MSFAITHEYVQNQVTHLKHMHPEADIEKLTAFVKEQCKLRYQPRKAVVANYPSSGNEEIGEADIIGHLNTLNDVIITPRGTTYVKPSKDEAMLRKNVAKKKAGRYKAKDEMFAYAHDGNVFMANKKNNEQKAKKVNTNAIFGNTGAKNNVLHDMPTFNAITSFARTTIILSYTHTERYLGGIYYVPTDEHIVNYITSLIRTMPHPWRILKCMEKYKISMPSAQDVVDMFNKSHKKYKSFPMSLHTENYIHSLNDAERAYVYYGGNLYSLIMSNKVDMREWIDSLFVPWGSLPLDDIVIDDFKKIDSDLIIMVASCYSANFGNVFYKDLPEKRYNDALNMIAMCKHMQDSLDEKRELFDTFDYIDAELPYIRECSNIQRESTVASDTDSVIFTTKKFIEWYNRGPMDMSETSKRINFFIVYMLSKSIIKVLDILCRNRGAEEKDIPILNMKNEFLYEVFIRSPVKKHYYGKTIAQEGRILAKPKIDIKGLQYKSSNVCNRTNGTAKRMMLDIMDDVGDNEQVEIGKYIARVVDYENIMFEAIMKGRMDFSSVVAVKNKEEYANYLASNYFSYMVWQENFADKYGEIKLGEKVKDLPLIPITQKNIPILFAHDKALGESISAFMKKYNKKKITHMLVSNEFTELPLELVKLVNIRKILLRNVAPFKIILASFGVTLPDRNDKSKLLFSDVYRYRNIQIGHTEQ